jgi:Ca2+/Na+ antiporter
MKKTGNIIGSALAIAAVLIPFFGILMAILIWRDILVLQGDTEGFVGWGILITWMVVLGLCICFFWKQSTAVRKTIGTVAVIIIGLACLMTCFIIVSTIWERRAEREWAFNRAEKGDAEAQYTLAQRYFYGDDIIDKNHAEAVKWYRMAAEQGHALAQNDLAYCYNRGRGVPEDKEEGIRWYRQAAEQGNAMAQCNLGHCYYNGDGVDKDRTEALKWYRKAAEQGYAAAQRMVRVIAAEKDSPTITQERL